MESELEGQATEATVDAAPTMDSTPEAEGDGGTLTLAEAFAAAKAELGAQPAEPAKDSSTEASPPDGKAEDAPATEQQVQQEPAPERPVTTQAVLDRIRTLVDEGRIAEMTPTERGIYNRIRQSFEREQQQEREFRDLFLELEAERQTDPEGFVERLLGQENGAELLQFYQAYKKAHPDVTLDNPEGRPKQPSPEQIRAEIRENYNTALNEIMAAVAEQHGADYSAVVAKSGNKLGTAITLLIDAAVEARMAKELPRRLEKEREAIRMEVQAEFAPRNVLTPKVLGNGNAAPVGNSDGPITWGQALAEAKAELERAS